MNDYSKLNKTKIYLFIGVLSLIALVVGVTFAYFQVQGGDDASANINVATNTTDMLQFKIDKGISIHATQENFSQGKGSLSDTSTATALLRANNKTNSATGRYNIYFVIEINDFIHTTKDNTAELLLNVTDPTGKKVENITGLINTGSGFDITTRTGGFLIVADYDIASNSSTQATKQDWKVEVTLVNLDSDQTANAGKSLSGKIYVTKEQLSTYELAQISKMTTTTTHDSISATAEVTPGTAEVKKYYFASEEVTTPTASVDNGVRRLANTNNKLTYVESTTPNYKFTNLKENSTYKIYSYVEDANGIKSNVYETEVTTDTYVIPKVDSVSHTSTLNSISLTVSASKGSNNIVSYLYSKDNGITYEESPNNTYTFNNLNDTTEYKIKVYVKDSNGKQSSVWSGSIATKIDRVTLTFTNTNNLTNYNNYCKAQVSEDNGNSWQNITMPSNSGATVQVKNNSLLRVQYTGTSPVYDGCGINICNSVNCSSNQSSSMTCNKNTIYNFNSNSNVFQITPTNTHYALVYCTCLTEETLVYVLDKNKKKKQKKMKELKKGDKIYLVDEHGKIIINEITKIHKSRVNTIYRVTLEDGEVIECSQKHYFFESKLGCMAVEELQIGYELCTTDGQNKKIKDITLINYPNGIDVYNLSFKDEKIKIFAITTAMIITYGVTLKLSEYMDNSKNYEKEDSVFKLAIDVPDSV